MYTFRATKSVKKNKDSYKKKSYGATLIRNNSRDKNPPKYIF